MAGSLDPRSYLALNFLYLCWTGAVLCGRLPDGIWCDAALRMMVRKIVVFFFAGYKKSPFAKLVLFFFTVSVPVFLLLE